MESYKVNLQKLAKARPIKFVPPGIRDAIGGKRIDDSLEDWTFTLYPLSRGAQVGYEQLAVKSPSLLSADKYELLKQNKLPQKIFIEYQQVVEWRKTFWDFVKLRKFVEPPEGLREMWEKSQELFGRAEDPFDVKQYDPYQDPMMELLADDRVALVEEVDRLLLRGTAYDGIVPESKNGTKDTKSAPAEVTAAAEK